MAEQLMWPSFGPQLHVQRQQQVKNKVQQKRRVRERKMENLFWSLSGFFFGGGRGVRMPEIKLWRNAAVN